MERAAPTKREVELDRGAEERNRARKKDLRLTS